MLKLGRYILTLKNCIEALSYASTAYVVASYGPFVKIWATCENFLGKWFTAPPAENCPYAYAKLARVQASKKNSSHCVN